MIHRFQLQLRPFLERFARSYREYRRLGFGVVDAIRNAWIVAR